MTDQQLLQRFAQAADQDAFAQLVHRHLDAVYRSARRQAPLDADDITQAVFLLLSQKAKKIPRHASLLAWLFRATRFCCLNARKMRQRRLHREQQLPQPAPAQASPTQEIAMQTLDDSLAKLPDKLRAAVIMRYMEGHSISETAAMLGISEALAAKRALRGLHKLRNSFARAGFTTTTTSIAATLLADSSALAPPAFLSHAILATVKTGTATASAAALAHATHKSLALAQLKSAALLLLGIASILGIVETLAVNGTHPRTNPPTPTAATIPATTQPLIDETQVKGNLAVAQYQALVEPDLAATLVRLTTAIDSPSTFYQLRSGPAQTIRLALRDAAKRGPLYVFNSFPINNPAVFDGWSFQWSAGPNYPILQRPAGNFSFSTDAFDRNTFSAKPQNNDLQLNINFNHKTATLTQAQNQLQLPINVQYTATLPRGQALVMIGDPGPWQRDHFVNIIITEAFAATDYQISYINHLYDAPTWLESGPPGARALADRATAWSHQPNPAPATTQPDPWSRTLSDGTVVRLNGISSPAQWPFCWWNANGLPIPSDWAGHGTTLQSPLACAIQVRTPNEDLNAFLTQNQWDIGELFNGMAFPLEPGENQITIYVPTKPWQEQPIAPNQTLSIDNLNIQLALQTDASSHFWAKLNGNFNPALQAKLYAITTNGQHLDPQSVSPTNIAVISRTRSPAEETDFSFEGRPENINHFILQTRQREPATFKNFPTTPQTPPPPIVPPLPVSPNKH